MICKLCKKEIPSNHVQQGGLHMGCHETEIDLWHITLLEDKGNGGYYENDFSIFSDMMKDMDEDSSYVITKTKMIAGKFYNLPEFEGF